MASPIHYEPLSPVVDNQANEDNVANAWSVTTPQKATSGRHRSVHIAQRSHASHAAAPSKWRKSRIMRRPPHASNKARLMPENNEEKDANGPDPIVVGWWSTMVNDSWSLEVVAGAISLAAFGSIVAVLAYYDNRPAPGLTRGITLNAVISFLATVSRSAIMLCISTALSQGKWLWFRKERSLSHLQSIENASRGPLGSMMLLPTFRGGLLISIAAILTILTLSFDPFVQQLLTTRIRVVPEPTTGVVINAAKSFYDTDVAMNYPDMDAVIVAAMLEGIQQPQATSAASLNSVRRPKRSGGSSEPQLSPLRPACPSGNCIWNPCYAIDICTQCKSTTAEVQLTTSSENASEPLKNVLKQVGPSMEAETAISLTWDLVPKNGRSYAISNEISAQSFLHPTVGIVVGVTASTARKVVWPLNFANISLTGLPGWEPGTFANVANPVAAIGFAEFDVRSDGTPSLNQSLECVLTYCVKEFNRSVIQGSLTTTVLSEDYGRVGNAGGGPGDPLGYLNWSAVVNDTQYASPNTEIVGISKLLSYLLGNSIHSISEYGTYPANSTSTYPLDISNATGMQPLDVLNVTGEFADATGFYQSSHNQSWEGIDLTDDFTTVLQNVVAVMSDILQQYGDVSIAGDNAVTKTFVVVRWAWIALPAICVLVGLIVLGLIIFKTRRTGVPKWGSSLLPLLYRYTGINDHTRSSTGDPTIPSSEVETGSPAATSLGTSNMLSKFDLEAEATSARLDTTFSEHDVWTLKSLEVAHRNNSTKRSRSINPFRNRKRTGEKSV